MDVRRHRESLLCAFEDRSFAETYCHTLYTGSSDPLDGACGASSDSQGIYTVLEGRAAQVARQARRGFNTQN